MRRRVREAEVPRPYRRGGRHLLLRLKERRDRLRIRGAQRVRDSAHDGSIRSRAVLKDLDLTKDVIGVLAREARKLSVAVPLRAVT